MTTAWVAPLTVMVATTGPPPAATDPVSNSLVALGSVLSCDGALLDGHPVVAGHVVLDPVHRELADDGFPPLRRSPCR